MIILEKLQRDLDFLTTLFNSRESRQVCLEEVLRVRNRWQKRTTFVEFKELATQVHGGPLDKRIEETRIRILIELTCAGDTRKKSMYSAAINNARKAGCGPAELSNFFKKKGGIRKAAYG
jgi:hypothetical protein